MILDGVKFGDWHSLRDFSLILTSKTISPPTVKSTKVDVDGMDGSLDLTDFFGEPKYENRTMTLNFETLGIRFQEFDALFSRIQNLLHGKFLPIAIDSDAGFYYMGRVSVGDWENDRAIGRMTITADCEPFKYKLYPTVITEQINESKDLILTNLRKSVTPTFTATSAMNISFEDRIYAISGDGTFQFEDFLLKEGKNLMTVTGTGTLTIEYQERGF